MVSLRERKARPSYANVSEDLANLTDEEEEEGSSGDEGDENGPENGDGTVKKEDLGEDADMGSSSGSEGASRGRKRSKSKVNQEEDDSMSSGDSSEFNPSDADGAGPSGRGGKGRGRARGGRGRGAGRRSTTRQHSKNTSSGSESEYAEELREAGEEVAEELRELQDVESDEDAEDGDGSDIGGKVGHGSGGGKLGGGMKGKGRATAALKAFNNRPISNGNSDQASSQTPYTTIPPSPGGTSGGRGVGSATSKAFPPYYEKRNVRGPLAAPPAYLQSDLNLLPASYRALIRSTAEVMVKSQAPPGKVWQHDKSRVFDTRYFPGGNCLPFYTRLIGPPREADRRGRIVGIGTEIEGRGGNGKFNLKVTKAESREMRRKRAVELADGITVGLGWEAWEGEGWWPEMMFPIGRNGSGVRGGDGKEEEGGKNGESSKAANRSKYPGVPRGWRLRDEVDLGLREVGRKSLTELEILSEQAAERYLPQKRDGSGQPKKTVIHVGPHGQQQPLEMTCFQAEDMRNHGGFRESHMFSAGGPIWGLDWCPVPEDQAAHHGHTQYLVITTLPDIATPVPMGLKWPRDELSNIQIWSYTPDTPASESEGGGKEGMVCEMVLCVKGGPGWSCKWMPMGAWDEEWIKLMLQSDMQGFEASRIPKLGILTVIQLDGSISVYAVPHPKAIRHLKGRETDSGPIFLKCHEPLLRLEMVDAAATCMDWYTGSKLAVGYSNGTVAVWDVAEALRSKSTEQMLPEIYVQISQCCIATIKVGRIPPADNNGQPKYDGDPLYILAGCYDGGFIAIDMRDPGHPVEVNRARIPCTSIGWSSQNSSPLMADSEYNANIFKIRGIPSHRSSVVLPHRGPIWDIATSDYHTMVASAASDGSVLIGSTQLGFFKARRTPVFFWRVLEIDYDQVTGHYRLTNDFSPESLSLEVAGARKATKKQLLGQDDPTAIITANWVAEVATHRVAWNSGSGLANAGLLAVGTASGLGFVEVVAPKWRPGFDVAGTLA